MTATSVALIAGVYAVVLFLIFTHMFFATFTNASIGKIDHGIDFNAFLLGATILKENPRELYNEDTQIRDYQKKVVGEKTEGVLSFRNTPLVALINIPYTYVSPMKAYKLNYVIQTVAAVAFVIYLAYLNKNKAFIPLAMLFIPTALQAFYGGITIVIAATYAGIYHLLRKGKYFWVGALGSLFILKVQYIIAIPYLFAISKDKKRFLAGFCLFSAMLIALDSLIYGSFYLIDYPSFLLRTEDPGRGTNKLFLYNIPAFLRIFGVSDQAGFIVSAIFFVATLWITFIKRNEITLKHLFTSLIPWNLSITYHSTLVDMIFLLIPIGILLKSKNKLLSYILIAILFLIPFGSFVKLQGVAGIALLAVGFINLFNIEKNTEKLRSTTVT
jgi:hypothetical protein